MKIETFKLERTQSLWENTVEYNLTETGIHPFTLEELLDQGEIENYFPFALVTDRQMAPSNLERLSVPCIRGLTGRMCW